MMCSSNAVVVGWAVVRNVAALKFITGSAALVAAGVGFERTLAGEGVASVLSVCLLAGALTALRGIIRLFPR